MTPQKSNIPALRFPEFKEEWEETRLGKIGEFVSGIGFAESEQGGQIGVPFFKVSDMNLPENTHEMRVANNYVTESQIKKEKYKPINRKSIIFAKVGAAVFLERKRLAENFLIDNNMMAFLPNDDQRTSFYRILFDRIRLSKYAQVGALPSYNSSDLKTIKLKLPLPKEQKKIADFLTAVDQKIAQLTEKKSCLEQYKKGVMQRLFTQRLRFHDANGNPFPDWEEKIFYKVFKRVTRKNKENNSNVLTISAQNGLVNQEDFFNKSVSANDVSGYYLLHKGEFAYNKSYSKGYPMGAIKRLKLYNKGVVSTLYICFQIQDGNMPEFFEQYFESGIFNHQLNKIAQEGARNHGLLNMSVVEFFEDTKLICPHPEEQQKIADFLTAIDAKIAALGNQLTAAQDFKKSLLQKMFV